MSPGWHVTQPGGVPAGSIHSPNTMFKSIGGNTDYYSTKLNAALQDIGISDSPIQEVEELNADVPQEESIKNYRDKVKAELSSSSRDLQDIPIVLESSK